METREGRRILLSLLPDDAPCTVNNFFDYIDAGAYDDGIVHRSVPGFVIQGGGYRYSGGAFASVPVDPPIVNEPGVSNLRGTIAMARSSEVNSATSQWFINVADNVFLDTSNEGFTVFGRVVSGMPVVDAIEAHSVIDACFALDSPFASAFEELPLLTVPVPAPGGYGCFDDGGGLLRALVFRDQFNQAFLELDPATNCLYYLSAACDGSGASAPPPFTPCSTTREVASNAGGSWFLDGTMTCDQIAESRDSLDAQRADLGAQIPPQLVKLWSVTYVPEPARTTLLLAGLALLSAIGRLSSRARPRARRA
jgi:cyclophilin family peptidyl-prolyl cis-trans isomerase